MNLTVIGTGFVGVVTAGVFASFGNTVYGLDIDEKKIEKLKQGKIPFFEPGLEELVKGQLTKGNLHFTTSYKEAIHDADVIMIAVGTPSAPDGQADLRFVFAAVESITPHLKQDAVVVIKSTVPPGTNKVVKDRMQKLTKQKLYIASVPEFLREGTAVQDTLHPDRIVIGANEKFTQRILAELHKPLNVPILFISPESAQMAKYSANSYLATRITFINQIADLCEKNGADVEEVIQGIGLDKRIGNHYWYPGFGYGGSCFPKDVKELAAYSRSIGEHDNLLNRINELNERRVYKLLDNYGKIIDGWEEKQVAILGLSFKKDTDDMREAPSLKVIPYLLSKGAKVSGYDPMATMSEYWLPNVYKKFVQKDSIDQTVKNADVIIALVEWSEIIQFDFAKTKGKNKQYFIDARNQFDPKVIRKARYEYIGVGRQF